MMEHWPTSPPDFDLPTGEAHIWAIALDRADASQAALAATLSPDERERAARLHFARDRRRWIAGRGLLRRILGRYLDRDPAALTFRYDCACGDPACTHPHRKPALADDPWLAFNLSHAGDRALVAIARERRIGIDLEQRRPADELLPVANTICAPAELEIVRRLPAIEQAGALLTLWTHKEAYLKARGIGFLLDPREVEFALAPDTPARLIRVSGDAAEVARWSIATLPCGPDHAAALAIEGGPVSIRCWRELGDDSRPA